MELKVALTAGEDGWIVARVPALPGCISQGRTREEAMVNIQEAMQAWLEVKEELASRDWPQAEMVSVGV